MLMDKSFSLSQWMTEMRERGVGDLGRLQHAIEQDFTKWGRLKKLNELIGLPIDKHTEFRADDVLNKAESVQAFFAQYPSAQFSIKAEPLEEFKDKLPRQRKHGITEQQCIEFVQRLKPLPQQFAISIWKHFESTFSGSIVVADKGIFVEAVQGTHSILTQGWKGDIITARFDYNKLELSDEKAYPLAEKAIHALRMLPHPEIKTYHGFVAGYFEFLYNENDGFRFIDYNTSDTMSTVFDEPIHGLITGVMASRGSCEGCICVVHNEKDFEKFQVGDILVAPMTDPSFVPLIARAAGIITDFGGLTCHAAIIAREFGIPCVVGTTNATTHLKDGDFVELRDGIIKYKAHPRH